MPKFNKSSGFKMKGYSYPGKSPIKKLDDPSSGNQSDAMDEVENIVNDEEGLTDEQRDKIGSAINEAGAKLDKLAKKNMAEARKKQSFADWRRKFAEGTGSNPLNPAGIQA